MNTFHVLQVSGWTLGKMQTVANDFKVWYQSWYAACINPNVSLTGIQVRNYNPSLPLAYDLPVSPPIPGTRASGTAEAASVSLTTSWRCGLAGRAFRGRDYLPVLGEGDVAANDTVVSALTTVMATAAGHLIVGAFTDLVTLCIFHRPGLVPKPLDNLITNVASAVIENIVDNQRRRLPGRGR